VRINPEANAADEPAIPIRMGTLEALRRIEDQSRQAGSGTGSDACRNRW
jgi:hypothetical protein